MKVAIMQPYFLPYLGYFSLIKHTDLFILLDTVQFIYHGWIERNRILNPQNGWQYIRVPLVRYKQKTKINDIRIRNDEQWQNKIIAQLQHYKKRAPFFNDVISLCETIFNEKDNSIVSLNARALRAVLAYLRVEKKIEIFSHMMVTIDAPKQPDDWALNICKAIGNIDEYWNPIGGKTFFDTEKYSEKGVNLKFHEISLIPYSQRRKEFEPGLSILDVLMFNHPDEINRMLDEYVLS